MGRDHSPKERQKSQLARKLGRRASYDRILIVSEGSKTEPNYFREIRKAHRLHTANVEVQPSGSGTAPIQVVEYARELFENGDRQKAIPARGFEKVFALIDRDDHETYYAALALAAELDGRLKNELKQAVTFKVIASVPSFELWLLLHFEDIQAPIHRDEVMRRLKVYLPDYEKGASNVFEVTAMNLGIAIQRAENLAARFSARDEPEPFTGVFDLVKILTSLRG